MDSSSAGKTPTRGAASQAGWKRIQTVYLLLLLFHTLAASLIWGINTLFLLDAGLSNAEAFAANAFFTAGLVLFEVPTGVVADIRGRRTSYLLGTATLIVSTLLYLLMWRLHAPFWTWAITSAFLGLGFTFFSGAMEAWLVDALKASGYEGELESVFARGQITEGAAMLAGSVAGGFIAQATNLGFPYILRAAALAIDLVLAFLLMRDVGFTPKRDGRPIQQMRTVLKGAIDHGLRNPPVRWIMLSAPFSFGVSIYAFYAMQPYLLQLYGNPKAYGVAGIAAAAVAGAQILGGLLVPWFGRMFSRRTSLIIAGTLVSVLALLGIGAIHNFWVVVALLIFWGLMFAAITPVRRAYVNGAIESEQRATVLSFDSLMGSSGGVVAQPLLGRAADVWGYPLTYSICAALQTLSIPFLWLARRERARSDSGAGETESVVSSQ